MPHQSDSHSRVRSYIRLHVWSISRTYPDTYRLLLFLEAVQLPQPVPQFVLMDRGARHVAVVASRGENRHGVAAHGVPGFLWRISKRAERPELALEEKLRLPKVSILFPYGSVTRSFSLCLPPFLSLSFSPLSLSPSICPLLFLSLIPPITLAT